VINPRPRPSIRPPDKCLNLLHPPAQLRILLCFRPKENSECSEQNPDCVASPKMSLCNLYKENVVPKRTKNTNSMPSPSPAFLMIRSCCPGPTNRLKFIAGAFQVKSSQKPDEQMSKICGQYRISPKLTPQQLASPKWSTLPGESSRVCHRV
jgi:hypothetical protein